MCCVPGSDCAHVDGNPESTTSSSSSLDNLLDPAQLIQSNVVYKFCLRTPSSTKHVTGPRVLPIFQRVVSDTFASAFLPEAPTNEAPAFKADEAIVLDDQPYIDDVLLKAGGLRKVSRKRSLVDYFTSNGVPLFEAALQTTPSLPTKKRRCEEVSYWFTTTFEPLTRKERDHALGSNIDSKRIWSDASTEVDPLFGASLHKVRANDLLLEYKTDASKWEYIDSGSNLSFNEPSD
ncbi:hypothetical protein BJ878DRAFT_300340 [Calycina marina]|uniref:Uncharacterized protein n=1 Tax=Calycina marina TaxID=1763456 RepID=A0A9P8CGG3_9HELO|nr:hypothetical protein BJ878DRAFT_300340 [Calycina marina]